MLTVACCLKSGGCYNVEYVDRLYSSVRENLNYYCKFVCLTDLPESKFIGKPYMILQLEQDLPKYWSKIELFRLRGAIIYFDLDTIILESIDELAKELFRYKASEVLKNGCDKFYMLKAFRKHENWASGIMAWRGDWSWIMNEFDKERDIPKKGRSWEQRYIKEKLKSIDITIRAVNDYLPKIYSYKHHCMERVPSDAGIICFHGEPRPHDIGWERGLKIEGRVQPV